MDATPSAFEQSVATLGPDGLRALVADLWRARGREVVAVDAGAGSTDRDGRQGPTLRVTLPDGTGRHLTVHTGPEPPSAPPGGVDVVVTGRRVDGDVDGVVDPAGLRRLLLYAVDRPTARDLCDRHLDGVVPDPDGGAVPASDATRPPAAVARDASVDDRRSTVDGGASTPVDAGSGSGSGPGPQAGPEPGSPLRSAPGSGSAPASATDATADDGPLGGRGSDAARVALVVLAVGGLVVAAAGLGPVAGVAGLGADGAAEGATTGTGDGDGAAGGSGSDPDGAGASAAGDGDADASGGGYDASGADYFDRRNRTDGVGSRFVASNDAAVGPGGEDGELFPASMAGARSGGSVVVSGGEAAERLPPGVSPDGTVDESTLATAHATALANTSYRATLTHREYVRDRPVGIRRETIRVENATRFVVDVEQYGELTSGSQLVAEDPSYAADGRRTVLVRPDETYSYDVRPSTEPGGPIEGRLATYVDWFLSVERSRILDTTVRDGRRLYWIGFVNDTYAGIENARGSALVDERGLVHRMTRTYEYPRTNGVVVTIDVELSNVGRTTADPPAWYLRSTAGNASATVDGDGRYATNTTSGD